MSLDNGGHLTHGSPVNFSGKQYKMVAYGVDPVTHRIDYDQVRDLARRHRPKMIIAGASAYPRIIDFQCFAEIAHEVGAVSYTHLGTSKTPLPEPDRVLFSAGTQKKSPSRTGTAGGLKLPGWAVPIILSRVPGHGCSGSDPPGPCPDGPASPAPPGRHLSLIHISWVSRHTPAGVRVLTRMPCLPQ